MLFFFDESFRVSLKDNKLSLGALCGIAIPERDLSRVSQDIYQLKKKHLGTDFAQNMEIKGKELLKNWVFKLKEQGTPSHNLELAEDLLEYITSKKLPVFGCVCHEKGLQKFQVDDVRALDKTFRFLFERIDTYMKINRKNDMANLVFDDRDFGINKKKSEAITNFFLRSAAGLTMDSIVQTPFFAISQSHNIGLQLADFVTTIIAMHYAGNKKIDPYHKKLKQCIVTWTDQGQTIYSLKIRG
jgi:hypothetical protein